MNDARFTGNLTRDPETKIMSNGKPRSMFTLAVQRRFVNQQTGKRDADFITFVAYDNNAEIAQKYLSKGRKILVTSHVKTGSYQKDGKTIYTTEFVVDSFEFMSAPQSQNQQAQQEQKAQTDSQEQNGFGAFTEVPDDELPF